MNADALNMLADNINTDLKALNVSFILLYFIMTAFNSSC